MSVFDTENFGNPVAVLEDVRVRNHEDAGYTAGLSRIYSRKAPWWFDNLFALANFVEPVDRQLGVDQERPLAAAFLIGELIGLRVLKECTPAEVQAKAAKLRIPIPELADEKDTYKVQHQRSQAVLSYGEQGLAENEGLASFMEELEMELLPADVNHQRYIRVGFGLIMRMIGEANRILSESRNQNDIDAIVAAETGAEGFDWNDLLI